jgi:hypothetical protein
MLNGVVIDDTELFNDKLQEWEELLQLPPPPRGPRWTDPLGTTTTEDHDPGVNPHLSSTTRQRRRRPCRRGTRPQRPGW